MSFLLFLLAFGLLIAFHEGGHALMTKLVGGRVLRFSLGFGPRVAHKKLRGTVYELRIFPLGGFVQLLNDESDLIGLSEFSEKERTALCAEKNRWVQNLSGLETAAIAVAGPAASILLGVVILYFQTLVFGKPVVANPPTVTVVLPGSVAAQFQLNTGDRVVSVNGTPAEKSLDIVDTSITRVYVVRHNGNDIRVTVPKGERLGVGLRTIGIPVGYIEAFRFTSDRTWSILSQSVSGLRALLQREGLREVQGPLGIFKFGTQSAQRGAYSLSYFLVVLTMGLGIFNLLPVPVLDGGMIVMGLIKAAGIRMQKHTQYILQFVGLVLLLLVMLAVTVKDLLALP